MLFNRIDEISFSAWALRTSAGGLLRSKSTASRASAARFSASEITHCALAVIRLRRANSASRASLTSAKVGRNLSREGKPVTGSQTRRTKSTG